MAKNVNSFRELWEIGQEEVGEIDSDIGTEEYKTEMQQIVVKIFLIL